MNFVSLRVTRAYCKKKKNIILTGKKLYMGITATYIYYLETYFMRYIIYLKILMKPLILFAVFIAFLLSIRKKHSTVSRK